jgi:hypothetical protein
MAIRTNPVCAVTRHHLAVSPLKRNFRATTAKRFDPWSVANSLATGGADFCACIFEIIFALDVLETPNLGLGTRSKCNTSMQWCASATLKVR